MTPIVTSNLGINQETGLQDVLNVWEVNINAKTELIRVIYEIITLSPTNVEVKTSGELDYYRYNSDTNPAFDNWRNSSIGQGITRAINDTIQLYPNLNQPEYPQS